MRLGNTSRSSLIFTLLSFQQVTRKLPVHTSAIVEIELLIIGSFAKTGREPSIVEPGEEVPILITCRRQHYKTGLFTYFQVRFQSLRTQ